jgi:ketosteroid isomerase-like protein
MEIWELVAREMIRDLVARYAHGVDRGRFDEVVALFADDAVLELPDGRRLTGHGAIRAFLDGTRDAARAAGANPFIRHHVASHHIDVEGPDGAVGFAYFFVLTERGPDHWGRYADRYARVGGRWLFASRRVRLDGWAPGSTAAERRRQ